MKSSILLRIAFALIILHILGHTMGHFTWRETEDKTLSDIITNMDSYQFEFMGKPQTIGGHHDGFSIIFEITLLALAALTWHLSGRIAGNNDLRPVLLITSLTLVLFGVVEFIYFFPLAAGMSTIAGILSLIAYARKNLEFRTNNSK